MYLYNSLTRRKEEFVPLNPPNVGMYTCGPTVYDYVSIGNLRTFVLSDILRRVLVFNGYQVKGVMNITDVGHLTGDNLGNADTGEDRLEKAAAQEHKTAGDIAKFYTNAFLEDLAKIDVLAPDVMPRATDHIKEQINLIQQIEAKGLTYKTSDGIYFDTAGFEQLGKKYGELSTLDQRKTGTRVEENPEKKNQRDFALWKFSTKPGQRQMEWESPWGLGFPGWHIECSAMSMKYLGETFDIHVGGEDLRQTHHPNEVAQSEAATGKQLVRYWVHGTHLLVDGRRMGKSLGNVYRINDVEQKGFDPLDLRYLYLTAHYRDPLNFTWGSLKAAQTAYERLRDQFQALSAQGTRESLSLEKDEKRIRYQEEFERAVNDDLNMPRAIAVLWEALKSNIPSNDKKELLLHFDEVLGLGLEEQENVQIPSEVQNLLDEREKARESGNFARSDDLRNKIMEMGFVLEDTANGTRIKSRSK